HPRGCLPDAAPAPREQRLAPMPRARNGRCPPRPRSVNRCVGPRRHSEVPRGGGPPQSPALEKEGTMEWSTRLLVSPRRSRRRASGLAALLAVLLVPAAAAAQQCMRTIKADIVALDQPIFYNRLGAFDPA